MVLLKGLLSGSRTMGPGQGIERPDSGESREKWINPDDGSWVYHPAEGWPSGFFDGLVAIYPGNLLIEDLEKRGDNECRVLNSTSRIQSVF